MESIDPNQFYDKNKKLFRKGRWYLFLDSYNYNGEVGGAHIAHRCHPEKKRTYPMHSETYGKSQFLCCLVIRKERCQDCNDPLPDEVRALQVLYNGGYDENGAWNRE